MRPIPFLALVIGFTLVTLAGTLPTNRTTTVAAAVSGLTPIQLDGLAEHMPQADGGEITSLETRGTYKVREKRRDNIRQKGGAYEEEDNIRKKAKDREQEAKLRSKPKKKKKKKKRPKDKVRLRKFEHLSRKELRAFRYQRDIKDGVDWSLVPKCYARCHAALAGPGARPNSGMSLAEYCADRGSTISKLFYPNLRNCLATCPERNGPAEYHAWILNNCGRA